MECLWKHGKKKIMKLLIEQVIPPEESDILILDFSKLGKQIQIVDAFKENKIERARASISRK